MEKEDRNVNISEGTLTNSPISSGNYYGSVTYNYSGTTEVNVADSITINKGYLQAMRPDYAESLEQLTGKINEELRKEKVPLEKVVPLQQSANDLAKELTDVKQLQAVPFEKKHSITDKFIKFGKALARASPTIARTVIGMTSLAPISGLVREAFEKIVEDTLKDQK
jgi:hypothetical protein